MTSGECPHFGNCRYIGTGTHMMPSFDELRPSAFNGFGGLCSWRTTCNHTIKFYEPTFGGGFVYATQTMSVNR
jgi:hypothetical protein